MAEQQTSNPKLIHHEVKVTMESREEKKQRERQQRSGCAPFGCIIPFFLLFCLFGCSITILPGWLYNQTHRAAPGRDIFGVMHNHHVCQMQPVTLEGYSNGHYVYLQDPSRLVQKCWYE